MSPSPIFGQKQSVLSEFDTALLQLAGNFTNDTCVQALATGNDDIQFAARMYELVTRDQSNAQYRNAKRIIKQAGGSKLQKSALRTVHGFMMGTLAVN